MRSKFALVAVLALTIFSVAAPLAQADCPLKGHGSSCDKGDCGDKGGCPILGAFKMKSHFFLENAQEIGLSEEQIATINSLRNQVKKMEIQQMAGMQVGMIDMEEKLNADPVDAEGLNAMIDQGMAEMVKGAKEGVAIYAKLGGVLTPDQAAKAKAIWKKSDK